MSCSEHQTASGPRLKFAEKSVLVLTKIFLLLVECNVMCHFVVTASEN